MPDNYRACTGHILPMENSQVAQQIKKTNTYMEENDMKLNLKNFASDNASNLA